MMYTLYHAFFTPIIMLPQTPIIIPKQDEMPPKWPSQFSVSNLARAHFSLKT